MDANLPCQCFLCHQRTFFKSTSDSNTDYHWWARIWSCLCHYIENRLLYPFQSICRLQHHNFTHVFTSESLRRHFDLHLITRNNFIMNNCWGVILCIFSQNRILYHRFSQISFHIPLTYPLIDSLFQISPGQMYLLSNL